MKVMHILQSNRFSGAENVVCQIISLLKGDDIEFVYCSQDGQIRKALDEREIEFKPIMDMSVSEFKRVIREEEPDIIHAHDMRASFMAALTCGTIPLISHIHNNNFDSRGLSLKAILYLYAAKKARHIFWVSNSSFEGYKFHNGLTEKSTILYNVIDIEALRNKMRLDEKDYDYEVVFLGRLTPQKNPHRLIDVFEKVLHKRASTQIAIVGTGELDQEIRSIVKEKGLENQITFLGFQSNPYKILHDAKVMVMTSRWEGTPMCALESMALGVPIVSTPTDGLADLVKDGVTGYLSSSDDILAEKIVEILENEDLYYKLSDMSKNEMEIMMDLDKYKQTLLDIYRIGDV